MEQPSQPSPRFGYTVFLYILGVVLLLSAMTVQLHFRIAPPRDSVVIGALRFVQAEEVLFAVLCLTVATLRASRSKTWPATTAALSILLALMFPIGTAVFVYWLVKVRRLERPAIQDVPCP